MEPSELPEAKVERVRSGRWRGLVPLMALFLALYLGAEAWYRQGPRITLHLEEGYSLGEGDALRFRGVDVGVVESVEVAPDLRSVTAIVRVDNSAEGICRQGSRFWLVRPELGVDHLRGLETVIGANYIRVAPGRLTEPYRFEFTALAEAPAQASEDPGGMKLRLLAESRGGLVPGAWVTYRGEQVGSVLGTQLTSDATGVEVEVHIQSPYVELVQSNSTFWRTGGFELNLALLKGLSVELESLRSLVIGGVAFATPEEGAELAREGSQFELHEQAEEVWREWRPSLSVRRAEAATPRTDLYPLRASLTYEAGRILSSEKKREGWVLPLPGAILGAEELLEVPEKAEEGSAALRVAGNPIDLSAEPTWRGQGLVVRPAILPDVQPLTLSRVQLGAEPQDCTMTAPSGGRTLAVSKARLARDGARWRLEQDINLTDLESGTPVWGQASARYIGVLVLEEDEGFVLPFVAGQF